MLVSTTHGASDGFRDVVTGEDADRFARTLARRLGEDPRRVALELRTDGDGPRWSTRFAAARGLRAGVFAHPASVRPTAIERVEARAVPLGATRPVRRTLGREEAEARGWLIPGTGPDEALAVLRRRALALLVEAWAPEALDHLPVSRDAEGWGPAVPPPPRAWVIYDDRGAATPRRPTSPERCLDRVRTLVARAEHPLRVLDLNATTLLAVAALVDDGTERVAGLWRAAAARERTSDGN